MIEDYLPGCLIGAFVGALATPILLYLFFLVLTPAVLRDGQVALTFLMMIPTGGVGGAILGGWIQVKINERMGHR